MQVPFADVESNSRTLELVTMDPAVGVSVFYDSSKDKLCAGVSETCLNV